MQGCQFVESDSQAVDLTDSVASPFKLLRCHIPQGPHHVAGLGEIIVLCRFGQSEVGNPDVVFPVNQQVGRFDVTVQDAVPVCIVNRIGYLNTNVRNLGPIQLQQARGAD